VFRQAFGGFVGKPIIRAYSGCLFVDAKRVIGDANGVNAGATEAMLVPGRTIFLVLHRLSVLSTDLVDFGIAPDYAGFTAIMAGCLFAVLRFPADLLYAPPAAVGAGQYLIAITLTFTGHTHVIEAVTILAVLIALAVNQRQALNTLARFLVTHEPVGFAIKVGLAGILVMALAIGSTGLAVRTILIANTHHALTGFLCTQEVPRTIFGGLAESGLALTFV